MAHRRWPVPPPLPDDVVARADEVVAGRFTYIGETYAIADPPDWATNPSADKEWQIAWHKHYFAPELAGAAARTGDGRYVARLAALLDDWLRRMGQGAIAVSDAQVEAKRVESWLAMLARLDAAGLALPPALAARLDERLAAEARYILSNLKRERNHRTFQLWSAFAVGAVHDDRELRDRAGALLTENLLRDLRPDGVQVEGSTHYHQLVTESALSFVELCDGHGVPVDPALRARLQRALEYCAWFAWPDGEIPLINDADDGRHDHLLERGARLLGVPIARTGDDRDFPDAGYLVLTAPGHHLFVDLALLGDGSHAHYDLGSFTYWCDGRPAVVDPGRYTYSSAPDADGVDWRHRFKSTASHSTVQVDGLDQTRYLNRTKRGPDAWLEERTVATGCPTPWGFGRIRSHEYAVAHERLVAFVRRSYVLVVDRLLPLDDAAHHGALRFHLPPDGGPATVAASLPLATAGGWVSPAYGVRLPAPVLEAAFAIDGAVTIASAVGGTAARPVAVEADGDGFTVRLDGGTVDRVRPGDAIAGRWELA